MKINPTYYGIDWHKGSQVIFLFTFHRAEMGIVRKNSTRAKKRGVICQNRMNIDRAVTFQSWQKMGVLDPNFSLKSAQNEAKIFYSFA